MAIRRSAPVMGMVQLLVFALAIPGLHCGTSKPELVFKHEDMRDFKQLRWEQDSTVLVMGGNGDFFTRPVTLNKGKHSIVFKAEGNIANKVLPHFVVRFGDFLVKELSVKEKVNSYTLNFELLEPLTAPFQFTFDNDYNDASGDRNVFLYYPIVVKPYKTF
jgi:hypothetical protein